MSYPVPATFVAAEYEIKKSRFIAWAGYAPDRDTALSLLSAARAQYPDARHHFWAYLLGDPHNAASAAMNDDGEPSGTAGKPILNVLQHKGVGDIMLVVTRYFGGVKLGAGGLVRAYSAAAQQVMESLIVQERVATTDVVITCDFSQEQTVRYWLGVIDGAVLNCDYSDQVILQCSVPDAHLDQMAARAAEHSWSLRID